MTDFLKGLVDSLFSTISESSEKQEADLFFIHTWTFTDEGVDYKRFAEDLSEIEHSNLSETKEKQMSDQMKNNSNFPGKVVEGPSPYHREVEITLNMIDTLTKKVQAFVGRTHVIRVMRDEAMVRAPQEIVDPGNVSEVEHMLLEIRQKLEVIEEVIDNARDELRV